MEIFDRKLSGMCLIEWVKERGGEKKKRGGMKIFAVKPNRRNLVIPRVIIDFYF